MKISESKNQHEILEYIGNLSTELAQLAKDAQCDCLSHLFAMALFETRQLRKQPTKNLSKGQRIH